MEQLEGTCQILWHQNYYDGVLSGMMLYEDKPCWFVECEEEEPQLVIDEDGDEDYEWTWWRKYSVIELTEEQTTHLFALHGLWQFMVGLHADYFPFNGRGTTLLQMPSGIYRNVSLHYGPYGDIQKSYEEMRKLREMFEERHGKLEPLKLDTVLGWITYDQLMGR